MSLRIRRVMKRRKPVFTHQESHKRKRLSRNGYKKSDGYGRGQRVGKRGKKFSPKVGYASPKSVRGLHACGKPEVYVNSIGEFERVDGDVVVRLSSKLGLRSKEVIARRAVEKKIRILNFKAQDFLKTLEETLKARKDKRSAFVKARAQKQKRKEEKEEKKAKEGADTKKEEKKDDIKKLEMMEGSKKKAPKQKHVKQQDFQKEKTKGLQGV
ncbi:hypothetical protein COT72_02085 [archaeon CG10_big_fil_rev_8_21_14_0_10_43_11]|nr:MAG: hypothetical protein COT72_02085 [archaeon CG10_big_fil_rev_8_21_14_0_10_43_11]